MSPQIEKQQFRNNTDGYIGAVVIGVKGDEKGVPIGPGETIWLSEAEQILTANAPRRPEDNPFLPQTMLRRNPETDAEEEFTITPLVAISESRYVPAGERPIPSDLDSAAAAAEVASGDEPVVPVAADDAAAREAQVLAAGDDTRPGTLAAPSRAAAAAAAAEAAAEAQASVEAEETASEPEEQPEAPQEPPAPPVEPPAPTPPTPGAVTPPAADPTLTVPEDEGRVPQVPEETAAVSPGPASEETGAAVEPSGSAPQGTFQPGEEVGTPDAPAASGEVAAETAGQQPPKPWTPESEG